VPTLLFCGGVLAQPAVSVVPSLTRVGQTSSTGTGAQANIYAARNETESFQIVVHAPSSGLSNVNVSVSNLAGPGGASIPSSKIALFRENYVSVSPSSVNWGGSNQPLGAGMYADGLIPFIDPATGRAPVGAALAAAPFNVGANLNQPIWVDVTVPTGTPDGQYSGTFSVTSSQGSAGGSILLTVWKFDLPASPALHSAFAFWNGEGFYADQELVRNRLSPSHTDPADQPSLMGAGLNSVGLPFWSGANISNCSMSPSPSVSQFQAVAAQQQSGLFKYVFAADEVGKCTNIFPTIQQWGYNMHQAGLKQLVTMAPNPALYDDGSGSGRSAVDIWTMLPVVYDQNASAVSYVMQKGDETWSYNALVQDAYSPKWLIDFSPANLRIQPGFISQSLGLTGLLSWRVDYWSGDPWNQVNNTGAFSSNNFPGEGMLVYPGTDVGILGVAPSMRLKWMRDGVDDYDYVNLLKGLGQGAWALQVAQSAGANWSNWKQDPNAIESARIQLGAKIHSLMGGAAATTTATTTVVTPTVVTTSTVTTLGAAVSPASGSGSNPTFTITVSDPRGYAAVTGFNILFNTSVSGANACWMYFDPSSRQLTLASDDTSTWSAVSVNSAGTAQNSQCSIAGSGMALATAGNNVVLTLPVSFKSGFAGAKTIFLRGLNNYGGDTGYQPAGAWTVSATSATTTAAAPSGPVTPSSGSGSVQTFTFVATDSGGANNIKDMNMLFNASFTGVNGCWMYYDAAARQLSLAGDDTSNWSSVNVGSASTVQNSQCRIPGSGITVTASGNNLSVAVPITFTSAFSGAKSVFFRNTNNQGVDTGYSSVGTWNVP
jgi:glycosyl hydrolase family 123